MFDAIAIDITVSFIVMNIRPNMCVLLITMFTDKCYMYRVIVPNTFVVVVASE